MRVSFRHADFEALSRLWNEFYPARFRVTPSLLERNTTGSSVFDWGASVIELNDKLQPIGFVAVKRSADNLYPGPSRDLAHVNSIAFNDPRIGVDLMHYTKQVLIQRGIDQLRFGQDLDHFFPGCPLDHSALKDFLLIEGFDEGPVVSDVCRDLADYSFVPTIDAEVRSCDPSEVKALSTFLDREFPGRWKYDCLRYIAAEGNCSPIDILWIDGEICGFAVTQDGSSKQPHAGAMWCDGENWCALGPIGVSAAIRGRGFGDALLAASLTRMRTAGKRNCTIDWTSLTDWYAKHGFVIETTYLKFTLSLSL